MTTLLRRFLVLAGLMFWQGGFVFYASVVVPVAQTVIGHTRQGFITRQVTDYLNLSGAVALVPLAWDIAASADPSVSRRRLRWACWLGMGLGLVALLWFHAQLNSLVDADRQLVLDAAAYRPRHRWYLWISTIQWFIAVGYTGLMLRAWREEDGGEK